MTTITFTDLRVNLAEMIGRVLYQKERILITRHGKVVAELVPSAAVVPVASQQHHTHHQGHPHPEVG